MDVLRWKSLQLHGHSIPASHVCTGERVKLVIDDPCQSAFLGRMFLARPRDAATAWNMWLETSMASYQAGTPEFIIRIGTMIRHRGLLANLSLKENLLLPFLYWRDPLRLDRAVTELGEVVEFLGLSGQLYEQAGERSPYTHALVSLGRCLLARPEIIVAQEVHVGMDPGRLISFRNLFQEVLDRLGSGLLYLTASEHEGSGIEFTRTLTMQGVDEMLCPTGGD